MENKNVAKDMEKLETSYTAGGNVQWCSHWGKLFGGSSKRKLNIKLPYDPAILLVAHGQRIGSRDSPMFAAPLSLTDKR